MDDGTLAYGAARPLDRLALVGPRPQSIRPVRRRARPQAQHRSPSLRLRAAPTARHSMPLLASSPLLLAVAAVVVLGLTLVALRCVGLAVALWPYDVALSAFAGVAALVLGGGAVGAAVDLAGQAARVLAG